MYEGPTAAALDKFKIIMFISLVAELYSTTMNRGTTPCIRDTFPVEDEHRGRCHNRAPNHVAFSWAFQPGYPAGATTSCDFAVPFWIWQMLTEAMGLEEG
ncbi:hypothetical protein ACJX0J_022082 [Zea mays]